MPPTRGNAQGAREILCLWAGSACGLCGAGDAGNCRVAVERAGRRSMRRLVRRVLRRPPAGTTGSDAGYPAPLAVLPVIFVNDTGQQRMPFP